MDTPYDMVRLDAVASTQDEAAARAGSRPVLVVAERQTGGRGRHGRSWVTADRALAASLAFRPQWDPSTWPRLALVAAVAAVDALVAAVPDRADGLRLKWPNDVLLGDDKVGGLLAESGREVATLGWGANLWWEDPVAGAAGLLDADPGPDLAVGIARRWAEGVLAVAAGPADRWGRDRYTALCSTIGRAITWEGGSGRALDVDETGALVVMIGGETVRLHSGEVREVRRR